MPWYINFCAPFLPNDPTINFHRRAQASLLALYTLAYAILHIYYKFCVPAAEPPQQKEAKPQQNSDKIQNESESIDSSEQASQKSKESQIKVNEEANQSCVELKKTGSTWNQTASKSSGSYSDIVTLQQIEGYFPIVFGHFAVAMGLSIMYTPYAEQSIACLVYMLLTIPLLAVNARRYQKWTRFVWLLMAGMLVFIFTCGLLEVGQSNWDFIKLTCFANEYVSFYD